MKSGIKTNKDKFTEIFDQYYHIVFNAVYPKVGNVNDTEDICQEVFIALYRKLDEIEHIKKWLFGTLRNIVYNYYRNKKPDKINIEDVFQDVSLTFVNGFRDARIIISTAIEEEIKNEEERQVVELIAFNNYSYAYVAKLLGVTKRMVQYRYTQLVKRILENLKNRGIKNIEDLL
jgi:RNA polymerase sigma-70 factor, ECF subfamily